MQLLILILKKVELMDKIMKHLAKVGVSGGTVLKGAGMAKSLANMDDLPMFGMLRRILDEEVLESSNVMLFVLRDEQVMSTRETIKKVIDLNVPNTGIMFSIPITYVEGLGE